MPQARQDGSVLLAILFLVIVMAGLVAVVISMSLDSYKSSMRERMRTEARTVAESELDYMFYRFKTEVETNGNPPDTVPQILAAEDILEAFDKNAPDPTPTAYRDAFLQTHRTAGWRIRRSMQFLSSESGRIPGTGKQGSFTYVAAYVEVRPKADSFFGNAAPIRIGYRFVNSSTSILQYGVFFEGDLELNPGGNSNTVVDGDVVATGAIYMGPRAGSTLRLKAKVRAEKFNLDIDGLTTRFDNPEAPVAATITLVAPEFEYTKEQQYSDNTERENFIGGLDPSSAAADRPDLFALRTPSEASPWSPDERAEAENNVLRSLIVPPPSASNISEYPNPSTNTSTTPDDPTIASRRSYNRAGVVVTIEGSTLTVTRNGNGASAAAAPLYTAALSAPVDLYDEREQKIVKVATVDIAALKTALSADTTFDFNGLLYVNLKNSSTATPAAVRLINGADLPTDAATGSRGFSVATNGGLYVQGSYNTVVRGDGTNPKDYLPALLMSDTITVLSSGFTLDNETRPITERVALPTPAELAGGVNINAGLLTGNTPSESGASSGGVQNLVRYMENWDGINVTYYGSLGRLFTSKWFDAPFSVTSTGAIYRPPASRTFVFDPNFLKRNPPATPVDTVSKRGVYFPW